MELKKSKKNQGTDVYGRNKWPEVDKLKWKEITINNTRKKLKRRKKPQDSRDIREISPKRCQMSMEDRI